MTSRWNSSDPHNKNNVEVKSVDVELDDGDDGTMDVRKRSRMAGLSRPDHIEEEEADADAG